MLTTSSDQIMFFCTMCYTKVSFALRVEDENTTKLQSVENKFSEKINNIEANCKLLELHNAVKDTHTDSATVPSPKAAQTLSPVVAIDEYLDRERRKCNLIVYNLQESSASTPASDRISDDKKSFSHLLTSEFKIDNIEFLKCIRLGKSAENRSRPLLISVSDIATKNNILGKATKLRKSTQYGDVYINPDRTKKERAAVKELRDESPWVRSI